MIGKQTQSGQDPLPSPPAQLSALAGYQRFGEYLSIKRKQFGLFQREMADYLSLTESMYGFLERGRRAPQVEELVSMFSTLVQLQSDKRLPPMQVIEAETFFRLAKAVIENKGKKRPDLSQQAWEKIEQQLIALVSQRQQNQIRLVSGETDASSDTVLEPPNSRRRKALDDILNIELKDVLEREDWATHALSYLDRVKISVIQAEMGAGKTHALAVLAQHLKDHDDLFVVPYQFFHRDDMTPEDHLDEFLATLSTDFTMRVADEKQLPLKERIEQVLAAIRVHPQKAVFLVDDVQEIFPSAASWSASWHQFFASFLTERHEATIYFMTRVWPGWDERKRSFLEEDNLPELSIEAGIKHWKQQGFDDVDDDLLRKVCRRCGCNPQVIEMLAFQYKRRGYSVVWPGARRSDSNKKNPHTASLEKLLESETLFSGHLDELSRHTLQQVFFNRLSGEDVRLLECLALAPLGIPFDLAEEWFDFLMPSYEKLVNASFADLGTGAAGRAAVIPLVREAVVQSLTGQQKDMIEQLVTDIYTHWLTEFQEFKDDAEKAALIAEMVVRYMRQRHLLKAAELFVTHGWSCATFGHMTRIQRVFEEMIKADRGKEMGAGQDVGRLLLSYHIVARSGQQISWQETARIYQDIHNEVVTGGVVLQPHMEIDILHNMMLKYIRSSLFTEANQMFEETLEHIRQEGRASSEVYASYLHNKSRLFARWGEAKKRANCQGEAHRLLLTCVEILEECIVQWRQCLKNALPLQEYYFTHKLARALNDYAYRQRLLGNLQMAQEAIEESIRHKKACRAPVDSLAVSLSEYSQLLIMRGRNQQAEQFNGEAVALMKKAIEDGNATLNPELGMLLVERADIYLRQARLDEEKQLLVEAVKLIGDDRSRKSFRETAERRLEEIQTIRETAQKYQLDKPWFARYHDLASYDDLAWLEHTGSFTTEEQHIWDRLYPQREEQNVSDQLDVLIVQARQRELARAQNDHTAPKLFYPHIPLEEVQHRIKKFTDLKEEIEAYETNVVVRQLYIDTINDHIMILRSCEATALHDQDTVWYCNEHLYGKLSAREMIFALQPFCAMLLRSQEHKEAGPLAQQLLKQLQMWSISPHDLAAIPPLVPKQDSEQTGRQQVRQKHAFSYETVQRFFQDILRNEYGTTEWKVVIAPARNSAYVNVDSRKVYLPPHSFTLDEIRDLLAEEIETHTYRSLSGIQSPLALLGSGLAKYSATEEGLANHYVQQVSRQIQGKYKTKSWLSALCIGLVCGVMTPALSFVELASFLERVFLVNVLRQERNGTQEELLEEARDGAWKLATRVFRGIPDLNQAGCCALKDIVYLRGYLNVISYLEENDAQRLYVGKIGIEHLHAMDELNILTPSSPHRHIALAPDLLDRILRYGE